MRVSVSDGSRSCSVVERGGVRDGRSVPIDAERAGVFTASPSLPVISAGSDCDAPILRADIIVRSEVLVAPVEGFFTLPYVFSAVILLGGDPELVACRNASGLGQACVEFALVVGSGDKEELSIVPLAVVMSAEPAHRVVTELDVVIFSAQPVGLRRLRVVVFVLLQVDVAREAFLADFFEGVAGDHVALERSVSVAGSSMLTDLTLIGVGGIAWAKALGSRGLCEPLRLAADFDLCAKSVSSCGSWWHLNVGDV